MLLVVWSLFLLGGFTLATRLEPSPRGFGTHQQLGLPPCSFKTLVGWPCPSCGMTTSFSHFVRGQWLNSLRTSTTGFVLAIACLVQIPWCLFSVWKKHLWRIHRPDLAVLTLLGILYFVAGAEWLSRFLRG